MSFKVSRTVQDLLRKIEKGTFAAINLYCGEDAPLEEIAAELENRLRPDTITLDASSYASVDDLVRDLIMQLLLRDDKPEDCDVDDDAIEEQSPKMLRRYLDRLLGDFEDQGSWICLIIKHFEDADSYWGDGDCGWVRELVDSGEIPACVILSSAPMSTICEKPVGSSPLYNIFRSYPLERGQE